MKTALAAFRTLRCACHLLLLVSFAGQLAADQLQMRNGDRYVGKVLSLSSNVVVLESSVLGRMSLPRGRCFPLIFRMQA
jgi:hypothetical protein